MIDAGRWRHAFLRLLAAAALVACMAVSGLAHPGHGGHDAGGPHRHEHDPLEEANAPAARPSGTLRSLHPTIVCYGSIVFLLIETAIAERLSVAPSHDNGAELESDIDLADQPPANDSLNAFRIAALFNGICGASAAAWLSWIVATVDDAWNWSFGSRTILGAGVFLSGLAGSGNLLLLCRANRRRRFATPYRWPLERWLKWGFIAASVGLTWKVAVTTEPSVRQSSVLALVILGLGLGVVWISSLERACLRLAGGRLHGLTWCGVIAIGFVQAHSAFMLSGFALGIAGLVLLTKSSLRANSRARRN